MLNELTNSTTGRRFRSWCVRVTAFLLLSGCAAASTSDSTGGVDRTRVMTQGGTLSTQTSRNLNVITGRLTADADRVWAALPLAYQSLGLQVNEADPTNRIMGLENVRVLRIDGQRLSNFLECGRGVAGPNADTYEITLRMLTQVVPADAGSEARVQIDAVARNRGTGGSRAECRTTGDLEERMIEVLRELTA